MVSGGSKRTCGKLLIDRADKADSENTRADKGSLRGRKGGREKK